MEHLLRNATLAVPIPWDIIADDGTEATVLASNLSVTTSSLDDGSYIYDVAAGAFSQTPAQANAVPVSTGNATLTGNVTAPFKYSIPTSHFPRGHYRTQLTYAATGQKWVYTYSVGLKVQRSLGYSAVYTGTALTLSIWVEENGEVQTDYTSLAACQLLNSAGALLTGGNLGTNSSSTNGVFVFTPTIALAPNSNFIFTCQANVPGIGSTSLTFALRVGLARP